MAVFLTIFLTVFLAKVGDKNQLATVLISSDGKANRWVVFSRRRLLSWRRRP